MEKLVAEAQAVLGRLITDRPKPRLTDGLCQRTLVVSGRVLDAAGPRSLGQVKRWPQSRSSKLLKTPEEAKPAAGQRGIAVSSPKSRQRLRNKPRHRCRSLRPRANGRKRPEQRRGLVEERGHRQSADLIHQARVELMSQEWTCSYQLDRNGHTSASHAHGAGTAMD